MKTKIYKERTFIKLFGIQEIITKKKMQITVDLI